MQEPVNLKHRINRLSSSVARIPPVFLFGLILITAASAYYSYAQSFMYYVTPQRAELFQQLALSYLLLLLIGASLTAFGLYRHLVNRIGEIRALGSIPLGPGSLIPYLLSHKKYARVFVVSALSYGLFYSAITSIVVYQPTVNFSEVYAAEIPSALVVPCCGPTLFVPITVVYLTEHLGLLLVPLSLILLVIVSALLGLNVTMALFAYNNRVRKARKGMLGGLGAFVGLFTGCPTCAGLFLAYTIGGTSSAAFATLLATYQPLFIGISIPVLALTPLLISRSLSKVFKEGCIILHGRE